MTQIHDNVPVDTLAIWYFDALDRSDPQAPNDSHSLMERLIRRVGYEAAVAVLDRIDHARKMVGL